jgi:hypothetical protein
MSWIWSALGLLWWLGSRLFIAVVMITLLGAFKDFMRASPAQLGVFNAASSKSNRDQDRSIFEFLGYASQPNEKKMEEKELYQGNHDALEERDNVDERYVKEEKKYNVEEQILNNQEIFEEKAATNNEILKIVQKEIINLPLPKEVNSLELDTEIESMGRFSEILRSLSNLTESERNIYELELFFNDQFDKGLLKQYEYDVLLAKLKRLECQQNTSLDIASIQADFKFFFAVEQEKFPSMPQKSLNAQVQSRRTLKSISTLGEPKTLYKLTERTNLQKNEHLFFPKLPPSKELYEWSDSTKQAILSTSSKIRKDILESTFLNVNLFAFIHHPSKSYLI